MSNQEAMIKMAELCGRFSYHRVYDGFSGFVEKKMIDSDWNPRENIDQAMEVLSKIDHFMVEKWVSLWTCHIHALQETYKFESDKPEEAIFQAVKKYLEDKGDE